MEIVCFLCEREMEIGKLLMFHSDCLSEFIAGLSSTFREMPEWSQRLIADRTPFLANDETFEIVSQMERHVSFKSRGFIYRADLERMQVV